MCQTCNEMKMRRIPVEEAMTNPSVFEDRVEELIKNILDKHNMKFEIEELEWIGDLPQVKLKVRRIV